MTPTNQVYFFATTFKASILSILLELCAFTLGPLVVNRKELKFIYFDVDYPRGIITSLHYGLLGGCLTLTSYDPNNIIKGFLP
jgi:hypothetical protein